MINTSSFVEVIFDVVVCHHYFPGSVVINRSAFYLFKAYYYCAMFYALDVILLLRPICKPTTLSKGQIAANKVYFLSIYQFWAFCEL